MERFPEREDDSWFSDKQIGAVARAEGLRENKRYGWVRRA